MNLRIIMANVGSASVSRLASAVLNFALFWRLANQLSPTELGGFALLMGLFTVLQVLPLMGLHLPLGRSVATHPHTAEQLVNEHWWFAWPVTVVIGLGLFVYGQLYQGGSMSAAFWLTGLAMVPTSWTMVAEAVLMGREQMRRISIAYAGEAVWRLVASTAVLLLGGQLSEVMCVFLIGRLASALYYWRMPGLPRPRLGGSPNADVWLGLWKQTPIYLGIVALASLSARLDILALSHLVSLREVGFYSAGAKLYEAALMVPSLAAMVILPPLARLFAEDRVAFVKALPLAARVILCVGLPIALFAAAAMPWGMQLMFPAKFEGSTIVAQVLVFAAVLATLDLILSSTMLAANAQQQDLRCLGVGVAVLTIGVVVLVPQVGIVGAAIAVTLHMAVRVAMRVQWAARVLDAQGIWMALARAGVAVAAGLGTLIVSQRSWPWPLAALLSLVAYVVVGLLVGLVDRQDLQRLRRIVRGAPSPGLTS